MSYCIVPLTNQPYSEQEFKLTLKNRRNINIKLKLRYNDLCAGWTAEIIDNSTGKTLIDTLPLVPGVNLLGQFGYLNIGEAYVIPTTDTELMMPDNTTLGSVFALVWGDHS